ncbi:SDR family NAD(P)-dependent oxidoreductase [Paracoccus aestuarii]|uniref:SDR family NAD(P)-dependent oxidoreductase n=1 Tax=Paracoccus aestuarii TaxID=453842 RepID=A0A418ZTC3_9RHOB|nr:SDR family NAD(P)-dependent oxidoreductase [Paracoccus aestuarii]RJL01199.1 SDR family NAD(P)-dependent oxidoreductase [Paracoccus aestuarii]WCQ99728.1 SDR family NAD(P)-dependent oxidoreductase [Paracoccus aestuarii]
MKRVLITGCSSGIGLDAARHLRDHGWSVVATCRRARDLEARRAEGMEALALDLADPASIADCAARVLAGGPLDALVNNAAFALPGAVEDMPADALRAIFEVNLFGTHDLTRRLIPHFRDRGGRIVTISSVLGLVGIPWRGPYVATKFALEGLTDVLRLEMHGTPVKVVLIEPGPITSRIRENAIPHFERWVDWQASPRADQYRATLLKRLYGPGGKDRFELPPRAVSDRILTALTAPNPAPRYYVTTPTRISGLARRVLPTRALDWFARRN